MMIMKLVDLLLAKPDLQTWNNEELAVLDHYSSSELAVIVKTMHDPVVSKSAAWR